MPHFHRDPNAGIDYLSREKDRKRLTVYLRGGNCKQLNAPKEFSRDVRRNRMIFCCIVSILFLTGLLFILF